MIQLKTLLREFEYGERLFDDVKNILNVIFNSPSRRGDITSSEQELAKFSITGIERNTKDEALLLKHLAAFLQGDASATGPGYPKSAQWKASLKELLALKSKFPQILDPTSSTGGKSFGEYVFRGATIPVELFLQLDWKFSGSGMYATNPGKTLRPRSKRGMHSFSGEFGVAKKFAQRNMYGTRPKDLATVACVIAVPITDSKLLFNPNFLNLFYRLVGAVEHETIYVNNSITPDHFIMPRSIAEIYINGAIWNIDPQYRSQLENLIQQFEREMHIKVVRKKRKS